MRYCVLITFAVVGMLAGCITQPVYSPLPVEPAKPEINPVHAKPRFLNTALNVVIPVKPKLVTDSILPPNPVVIHVQLTGFGAEWSTLHFATNWIFTALVSNDLLNWVASNPTLDAAHSFYITSSPPIFCNAYWQSKAQPGNQ